MGEKQPASAMPILPHYENETGEYVSRKSGVACLSGETGRNDDQGDDQGLKHDGDKIER